MADPKAASAHGIYIYAQAAMAERQPTWKDTISETQGRADATALGEQLPADKGYAHLGTFHGFHLCIAHVVWPPQWDR